MTQRGHFHEDPRPTEVEAAIKVGPSILPMRQQILKAIADAAGMGGLTPDEFAEAHGKLINTVRRRFVDLWKDGRIRPTANTRPNVNGNRSVVWVSGEDPDRRKSRTTSRKQLIQENQQLRRRVDELEARVRELEAPGQMRLI